MKKVVLKKYCIGFAMFLFFLSSCKKDNHISEIFIKKQWKVDLTVANVVPAVSGRTDHAVAMLFLMDNKELHYDIYFDKPLENNDTPGSGKLYLGTAGVSGAVFIDLATPAFDSNREAKGKVAVSDEIYTKIQTEKLYLQLSSAQQQNGLVRGQVN